MWWIFIGFCLLSIHIAFDNHCFIFHQDTDFQKFLISPTITIYLILQPSKQHLIGNNSFYKVIFFLPGLSLIFFFLSLFFTFFSSILSPSVPSTKKLKTKQNKKLAATHWFLSCTHRSVQLFWKTVLQTTLSSMFNTSALIESTELSYLKRELVK